MDIHKPTVTTLLLLCDPRDATKRGGGRLIDDDDNDDEATVPHLTPVTRYSDTGLIHTVVYTCDSVARTRIYNIHSVPYQVTDRVQAV